MLLSPERWKDFGSDPQYSLGFISNDTKNVYGTIDSISVRRNLIGQNKDL